MIDYDTLDKLPPELQIIHLKMAYELKALMYEGLRLVRVAQARNAVVDDILDKCDCYEGDTGLFVLIEDIEALKITDVLTVEVNIKPVTEGIKKISEEMKRVFTV